MLSCHSSNKTLTVLCAASHVQIVCQSNTCLEIPPHLINSSASGPQSSGTLPSRRSAHAICRSIRRPWQEPGFGQLASPLITRCRRNCHIRAPFLRALTAGGNSRAVNPAGGERAGCACCYRDDEQCGPRSTREDRGGGEGTLLWTCWLHTGRRGESLFVILVSLRKLGVWNHLTCRTLQEDRDEQREKKYVRNRYNNAHKAEVSCSSYPFRRVF